MSQELDDLRLTEGKARKALGQHFLFDPDVLGRIAGLLGPLAGQDVLEVGPGPGGLTRAILAAAPRRLLAVEKDIRFAEGLMTWPQASGAVAQLVVVEGDATELDYPAMFATHGVNKPFLIANLPYNVGTPLLVGWLRQSCIFGPMALMFQKEVAQRIIADVGTSAYGRLAVLCQSVRCTRIAMTLPPGAFRPPPKVASAVVVLHEAPGLPSFDDLAALEVVTASAFGQRRKMLRSSLRQAAVLAGVEAETLLEEAEIAPTARAEQVDVAGFQRLARVWRQVRRTT